MLNEYKKFNIYFKIGLFCFIFIVPSGILVSIHILFIFIPFIVAIIGILFYKLSSIESKKILEKKYKNYKLIISNNFSKTTSVLDINDTTLNEEEEAKIVNEIIKYDPNFSKTIFDQNIFICLKSIWDSFQNENLTELKYIESESLYERHLKILEKNKVEKNKIIFHNIRPCYIFFKEFNTNKNEYSIRLEVSSMMRYYKINKSKKVISGNKNEETSISFEMEFIKKVDNTMQPKKSITDVNCPNCDSTIDITFDNKCSYCNSYINPYLNDWILNDFKCSRKGLFQ